MAIMLEIEPLDAAISRLDLALVLRACVRKVTDNRLVAASRALRGTRHRITVVNREGLLGLANGFYGVPEAEYDRMIRPRRAPRRT